MRALALRALSKAQILELRDVLIVLRAESPQSDRPVGGLELLLAVMQDGTVAAFNGHVDLGTGIRTALTQIVADELDVAAGSVTMILGDTDRAPDQGATIASDTMQSAAVPLQNAAARARHALLTRAAAMLNLATSELSVEYGVVYGPAKATSISYGALIHGTAEQLLLDEPVLLKDPAQYRIVGESTPRVDIPGKVAGTLTFVHDVRLPGMLHGRVVRPPYHGLDSGPFIGTSLLSVDHASVAHIPGVLSVLVIGDFIGVVCLREEHAMAAAAALVTRWKPLPKMPDPSDVAQALRSNPGVPRMLLNKGDVDAAIAGAAKKLQRDYVWPYQMHASIGPSCAVADYQPGRLTVWSGTQNPHTLRLDLAHLMQIPEATIEVIRLEASGCYGRNCADDVAADAALLSRAVGSPVRVQLSREQEHLWEPKGAAQLMEVNGGLDENGAAVAYDFSTRYPSNGSPVLALLLTGAIPAVPTVYEMGDRTSVAPYDFPSMRVVIHDMPPLVRASWLRGVSALPNTFAHESYIDELAAEAGIDPIEYRLRYLKDARAVALVRAVAERAKWIPHTRPGTLGAAGDILRGRGFAYALYSHSRFPGSTAAWSAWVADVEVNRATGVVCVTHVTTGHDAGLLINPAGVLHQIEGNVIQSTSRVLKEQVRFERGLTANQDWGSYPILTFPELPVIDVLMMRRPEQPPLGAGESASVPSAAAIANAVFDATGVRFRELPLTPERVKAGIDAATAQSAAATRPLAVWAAWLGAMTAAAAAVLMALAPARVLEPLAGRTPGLYSAETISRGRLLASVGDCVVCHTQSGGAPYAGGRLLQTPFGVVYSTNITSDSEFGIGSWTLPAFERAMREGIHRDGRHLYPAFPYTAYANTTAADLEALYAYLMTVDPVRFLAPKTTLTFPLNVRPLMAFWNLLFLKPAFATPAPRRTAEWNRGAYLVEGLGHCSACHSPRNFLGAERQGKRRFGGGWADGWEAPALNHSSKAPVLWTRQALFDYLRRGQSEEHGTAAGPMKAVVQGLSPLPDTDVMAMATYVASLNEVPIAAIGTAGSESPRRDAPAGSASAQRLFDGACAVCHEFSSLRAADRIPLSLNSNLFGANPNNVIRAIMEGVEPHDLVVIEPMPAFMHSLSDEQVSELARFLRARFAPDLPPWENVDAWVSRTRKSLTGPRTAAADAARRPGVKE